MKSPEKKEKISITVHEINQLVRVTFTNKYESTLQVSGT